MERAGETSEVSVGVEEGAGVEAVSADSSDDSGEVDDDVGVMVGEEAPDVFLAGEVVVRACRNDDLFGGTGAKLFEDVRAEEAPATGDGDSRPGQVDGHGSLHAWDSEMRSNASYT